MNEYLNEIMSFPNGEILLDEKIIYVMVNEKLHANRRKKIKSRSIYCKGDLVEKNNKQQN